MTLAPDLKLTPCIRVSLVPKLLIKAQRKMQDDHNDALIPTCIN